MNEPAEPATRREPGIGDQPGLLEPGAEAPDLLERPVFIHPPWTVGVVLVIGLVMLVLGLTGHYVWLLLGAPFIVTLLVWVAVRTIVLVRGHGAAAEDD